MTTTRPERQPPSAAEREAALLREIADLTAALDAIRTGGLRTTTGSADPKGIDPEVAAAKDREVLARSDALTGLLNRREVLKRMSVLTSHPRRSGEEAAVLCGDIDRLETINDKFGRSAGDEVLKAVANRISACLRSGDLAARIGGDELLVLLDGVHELANAVDIADNIRRAVARPIRTDGQAVSATLSIGVTLAVPGEDVDEMIARADEAMHEAKQAGGDRVVQRMPASA